MICSYCKSDDNSKVFCVRGGVYYHVVCEKLMQTQNDLETANEIIKIIMACKVNSAMITRNPYMGPIVDDIIPIIPWIVSNDLTGDGIILSDPTNPTTLVPISRDDYLYMANNYSKGLTCMAVISANGLRCAQQVTLWDTMIVQKLRGTPTLCRMHWDRYCHKGLFENEDMCNKVAKYKSIFCATHY